MNFNPSPFTASVAGIFSALALPLLRSWFGGESSLSLLFLITLILTVALPAHALVFGFGAGQASPRRSLDTALLKRIGAWIAGAAVATVVRLAV